MGQKENNRKYYLANKDKVCAKSKQSRHLYRYGITEDQYNNMVKEQEGLCLICAKTCSTGRNLSVDHCHKTGTVRGLVCNKCNTGLGMFNDDPALIKRALEHLNRLDTDGNF